MKRIPPSSATETVFNEEQIQRIEEFVAMDIKIYNYAMEKYAIQKKKYADILQKS